eukprot:803859-Amphidinium_carterae.2
MICPGRRLTVDASILQRMPMWRGMLYTSALRLGRLHGQAILGRITECVVDTEGRLTPYMGPILRQKYSVYENFVET